VAAAPSGRSAAIRSSGLRCWVSCLAASHAAVLTGPGHDGCDRGPSPRPHQGVRGLGAGVALAGARTGPGTRPYRPGARRRPLLGSWHARDIRVPADPRPVGTPLEDGRPPDQGHGREEGRKPYALPSIFVLDVSRLGYTGHTLTEAGIARFQEVLDGCGFGNLGGVLVIRSWLDSQARRACAGEANRRCRCWSPAAPCGSAASSRCQPDQGTPPDHVRARSPAWLSRITTRAGEPGCASRNHLRRLDARSWPASCDPML
jgi:hypothetical protein